MRTDRLACAALALAAAFAGAGCAASVAPPRWLPKADQAQREAWGGWIELGVARGSVVNEVSGELLAVSDDSVYTLRGRTVTAVALADVRQGRLDFYDPQSSEVGAVVMAGTLSTLTHGWVLILSAPVWAIVGGTSTARLSGDGKMSLDPALPRDSTVVPPGARSAKRASWRDLRMYARFPAGWPPGLDRGALHERPPQPSGPRRGKPSQHGVARY